MTDTPNGSPVLTLDEAAHYLRLDEGVTKETAHRYVSELVSGGHLRALGYGRRMLFACTELDRFIVSDPGVSDVGSGGDE